MAPSASRRTVGLGLSLGTALVLAPLAGCGSGPSSNGVAAESAAKIYAAAKAATASASSVRYSGHLLDAGKAIAINIVAAGQRGGGTITLEGATLNIVSAGTALYLKANAAAWTKLGAGAAAARLVADKWLQTSTSNKSFSQFANFTNLSQLVGSISATHTPTKGAETSVNGQSAITLTDQANGKLFVATTGKPYILEIESTKAGTSGVITFTDYNNATPPAVPANPVNINSLTGSG